MTEFIAEVGSNWYVPTEKGLERAKKLIESAAKSGADVVKFQLFRANELYRDSVKQGSLKHLELPLEWIPALKQECDNNGVEFLCTPFYVDAISVLSNYVQRWKIASWDLTYKPLLTAVAETGMPMILSTGAATFPEVDEALKPFTELDKVTLLHCTGGYPTEPRDMVLRRILDLATEFFPVHVGLSSHCIVPHITAASVLYGAEIIEVHYDLKDKLGAEASHSYSPQSFTEMIKLANQLGEAKDCGCERTLVDAIARNNYYRDPSDWLRPVLNPQ